MTLPGFCVKTAILYLCLWTLSPIGVLAQTDSLEEDSLYRGQRVMLIGYFPNNYLNDDNQGLASLNEMSATEVEDHFKNHIYINCLAELRKRFVRNENVLLHSGDSVFRYLAYKPAKTFKRTADGALKTKAKKWVKGIINKGEVEPKYFMKNRILDTAYFENLILEHQIDFLLFVNQFEVSKDFFGEQNRSTRQFHRRFKLHYEMYDHRLKGMVGGVEEFVLEDATEDLETLLSKCIPPLIQTMIANLFNTGANH